MQELLWRYPQRFLNEPLKQFAWETSSGVGRADLVFEDRHGRLLIIEVKRGKLPRGAIDQLLDYFGMMKMMKQRFPGKPVELMVVANAIPQERRLTCESRDIECREISDKTFREVALEVAYTFGSEVNVPQTTSETSVMTSTRRVTGIETAREGSSSWSFSKTADSTADAHDFLSRCDEDGRNFFMALLPLKKPAPAKPESLGSTRVDFHSSFTFIASASRHSYGDFPLRIATAKALGSA